MSYLELPETDDPEIFRLEMDILREMGGTVRSVQFPKTTNLEIIQMQLDYYRDLRESYKTDKKVIPVLIVLVAVGLSLFPLMMIIAFILSSFALFAIG